MARIEKLKNVVINTGKKLYREHTIDENTVAMFDARSLWAGSGKNLVNGDEVKDLTYNAIKYKVENTTIPISFHNNGLRFADDATQKGHIDISKEGTPNHLDEDWVCQFWVSIEKYAEASANNVIFTCGTMSYWNFPSAICALAVGASSDLVTPTALRFGVCGIAATIGDADSLALFTGSANMQPIHVAVHAKYVDTTVQIKIYLNNVLKLSQNSPKMSTIATDNTINCFNNPNVGHNKAQLAATYYRYRFDKIASVGISASDLIALEHNEYKNVFTS